MLISIDRWNLKNNDVNTVGVTPKPGSIPKMISAEDAENKRYVYIIKVFDYVPEKGRFVLRAESIGGGSKHNVLIASIKAITQTAHSRSLQSRQDRL